MYKNVRIKAVRMVDGCAQNKKNGIGQIKRVHACSNTMRAVTLSEV